MATLTKSTEKKIPRSRRMRLFGCSDSILSNTTVYLNPYPEPRSPISGEKAALFAAATRSLNRRDS